MNYTHFTTTLFSFPHHSRESREYIICMSRQRAPLGRKRTSANGLWKCRTGAGGDQNPHGGARSSRRRGDKFIPSVPCARAVRCPAQYVHRRANRCLVVRGHALCLVIRPRLLAVRVRAGSVRGIALRIQSCAVHAPSRDCQGRLP